MIVLADQAANLPPEAADWLNNAMKVVVFLIGIDRAWVLLRKWMGMDKGAQEMGPQPFIVKPHDEGVTRSEFKEIVSRLLAVEVDIRGMSERVARDGEERAVRINHRIDALAQGLTEKVGELVGAMHEISKRIK